MTPLRTADFDYELPPSAIAQRPAERGRSRLLVLDAAEDERHRSIADLPDLLREGDLMVLNDTRVLAARLDARTESGGRMEVLLLEPTPAESGPEATIEGARCWEVLIRPGRKARPGRHLVVEERSLDDHHPASPALGLTVVDKMEDRYRVQFTRPIVPELDRLGHIPLPPYIDRTDDETDRDRYQTLWAATPGAVAAPTAGLHLDQQLLDRVRAAGVGLATVTLHTGLGTFRPVDVEDPSEHRMHAERTTVSAPTVEAIERTKSAGGRIVAVGTTVVRALESAAQGGSLRAFEGRSDLFITPGYRFEVVDALLTNFHLPRSTLLMMVSAFAGHERVMAGYREAVDLGYRFYSYGDAMWLERGASARPAGLEPLTRQGAAEPQPQEQARDS